MGEEMVLRLVSRQAWHTLLQMELQELVQGFKQSTLRELRPTKDSRL